jgi:hypothetical protein
MNVSPPSSGPKYKPCTKPTRSFAYSSSLKMEAVSYSEIHGVTTPKIVPFIITAENLNSKIK